MSFSFLSDLEPSPGQSWRPEQLRAAIERVTTMHKDATARLSILASERHRLLKKGRPEGEVEAAATMQHHVGKYAQQLEIALADLRMAEDRLKVDAAIAREKLGVPNHEHDWQERHRSATTVLEACAICDLRRATAALNPGQPVFSTTQAEERWLLGGSLPGEVDMRVRQIPRVTEVPL